MQQIPIDALEAERFQAWDEIEERPRYNIAPTQPVLTVRKESGKKSRKFTTMRWELIPSWTLLANSGFLGRMVWNWP